MNIVIQFVILGIGGRSEWIGDDFCDDINNNEKCLYDDGDCCGLSAQKNFCFKCTCKGKLEHKYNKELTLVDMSSSSSVFMCKVDSDCHGNGYCKNEFDRELERVVGKCMCLDQYKYKPDCSEYACKYNYR